MRAVIAAGGTAGHINPALAIAGEIMKNEPGSEIVFVGREDGMEKKLVERAGYRLFPLETHGFMRSVTPENIAHNFKALKCVFTAEKGAEALFREFSPDIVIGCGGYVSGPVVRRAQKLGIPTAIHEQNSFPGITTKLLAKNADVVFVANDEIKERLGCQNKTMVVGNPVKEEFFTENRERCRRELGVGARTCILSFGGSLGARTINEISAKLMKLDKGDKSVFHVHATGQYAVESFPKLLAEYGVDVNSGDIRVEEYINDMPRWYAAADLIISRSGAITVSEIIAAGKPSVLIPSPNVTENHQYYNALTLKNAGAAYLFEEKDLDEDAVAQRIRELAKNSRELKNMGVCARSLAVPNTSKRIYDTIKRLASRAPEN